MKGVFCVKESTKAYLVDIYNSIPKKTKATCLKFYYQYHNVNVNVYFDAFDNQSVVLSIVLSAKNTIKIWLSAKTQYLSAFSRKQIHQFTTYLLLTNEPWYASFPRYAKIWYSTSVLKQQKIE